MDLRKLQRQLEKIYEVDTPYDVEEFLITDPALARVLGNHQGGLEHVPEKLLIRQSGDSLDISLFIDQELMEFLRQHDPTKHLHNHNLPAFCTAVEGVSHFLYLIYNAHYGRSITLFELELQAEVDKFIAALCYFSAQRNRRIPHDLHQRLFENVSYYKQLDAQLRDRYEQANDYARRYCERLLSHYLRPPTRNSGLVNDLRRFYRLTRQHKLDHIEARIK